MVRLSVIAKITPEKSQAWFKVLTCFTENSSKYFRQTLGIVEGW